MFWKYYGKICDQEILKEAMSAKIMFEGRPLQPEVCSEILHFMKFTNNAFTSEQLIQKSSNIYSGVDALFRDSNKNSRSDFDEFYKKTFDLIPWGHGTFHFDHDDGERRKNYLRRGVVVEKIKSLGVKSFLDYGGGCGHFSLLTSALGIEKVEYCEYSIFHPYILWRFSRIKNACNFIAKDVENWAATDLVDCVLCFDVAEHVYDVNEMMQRISSSLKVGGFLFWVSVFGEGISCHIHPELKGKEDDFLQSYCFVRQENLPVNYVGHSGIFKKVK